MLNVYWIPEVTGCNGVYANFIKKDINSDKFCLIYTRNPNAAIKFDRQKDCQEWCNAGLYLKFTPKEYWFCTSLEDLS